MLWAITQRPTYVSMTRPLIKYKEGLTFISTLTCVITRLSNVKILPTAYTFRVSYFLCTSSGCEVELRWVEELQVQGSLDFHPLSNNFIGRINL